MVCYKRGIYWSIEQPESSVMFSHPRVKKMMAKTKAKEVSGVSCRIQGIFFSKQVHACMHAYIS